MAQPPAMLSCGPVGTWRVLPRHSAPPSLQLTRSSPSSESPVHRHRPDVPYRVFEADCGWPGAGGRFLSRGFHRLLQKPLSMEACFRQQAACRVTRSGRSKASPSPVAAQIAALSRESIVEDPPVQGIDAEPAHTAIQPLCLRTEQVDLHCHRVQPVGAAVRIPRHPSP